MKTSSIITLSGVAGFLVIVSYLHIIQVGYSPLHQLMSELALGQGGSLMLFAFLCLSVAIASAANILFNAKAPAAILLLVVTASIAMAGAGIFKLGAATTLHVTLIALAFVQLGLVMYLVPRYVPGFQESKVISWGFCCGMALAVALGANVLPIGVAQRLATGFVLLWLCWLAIFATKKEQCGA